MGSPVKWGIVSTADINRKVIPGAHASDKVDLVAVASREAGRAEAYAREWEIPRAYGSYEDLLADAEIEAVYVSLPNTLHVESELYVPCAARDHAQIGSIAASTASGASTCG